MMAQKPPHILLVEDTASLAGMYENYLSDQGYAVTSVLTGHDALNYIAHNQTDLIILDLKLPDMGGLEVMAELIDHDFKAPIIVITGHGSINTAVEAMRKGAWDFLVKPFNVARLGEAVEKGLERGKFEPDNLVSKEDVHMAAGANLRPAHLIPCLPETSESTKRIDKDHQTLNAEEGRSETEESGDPLGKSTKPNFGGFIGTSPIMQDLYKKLENVAKSQAPVFITGESGTGKEICAEAIHKYSNRSDKPFIPINCAAIPKDLIESELFGHVKGAFTGAIHDRDGAAKLADGGTLFLDEIAEMDVNMQTKLLRFLQNYIFQKVGGSRPERTDVRIICATNRNPHAEIHNGNFREDLFYRLYVIPVHMPALSKRGDDIIDIAHALLRKFAKEENKSFKHFSEDAENNMRVHSWPGNIRELQNIVRNIVVMNDSEIVTAKMLPSYLGRESESHRASHDETDPRMGAEDRNFPPVLSNISYRNEDFDGLPHLAGSIPTRPAAMPQDRPGAQELKHCTIRPLWLIEKRAIENAIEYCGGNIPKAASLLEVSPSTIYRKKANWNEGETI